MYLITWITTHLPTPLITIEGLRERIEHLDIFLFFPSLNGDLFPVFCLLLDLSDFSVLKLLFFSGTKQFLLFDYYTEGNIYVF